MPTIISGDTGIDKVQDASIVLADLASEVYQTGTWTPVLRFGGAAVGLAYTSSGTYKKVGNVVHVNAVISLTNKGSSAGAAVITGMPFSASDSAVGNLAPYALSFSGHPYVQFSGSNATLYATTDAGNRAVIDNTNFQNTSELIVTATYFTS